MKAYEDIRSDVGEKQDMQRSSSYVDASKQLFESRHAESRPTEIIITVSFDPAENLSNDRQNVLLGSRTSYRRRDVAEDFEDAQDTDSGYGSDSEDAAENRHSVEISTFSESFPFDPAGNLSIIKENTLLESVRRFLRLNAADDIKDEAKDRQSPCENSSKVFSRLDIAMFRNLPAKLKNKKNNNLISQEAPKTESEFTRKSPANDDEQNRKSDFGGADSDEDSEARAEGPMRMRCSADDGTLSEVSVASDDGSSRPTDDSSETRNPGRIVDPGIVDTDSEEAEESDVTTTCNSLQEPSVRSTTDQENCSQAADAMTNTTYSSTEV